MKLLKNDYSWKHFGGDIFGGAISALIALAYRLAMATLMGFLPSTVSLHPSSPLQLLHFLGAILFSLVAPLLLLLLFSSPPFINKDLLVAQK